MTCGRWRRPCCIYSGTWCVAALCCARRDGQLTCIPSLAHRNRDRGRGRDRNRDRQADRQTNRQTDTRTDRRTDTSTHEKDARSPALTFAHNTTSLTGVRSREVEAFFAHRAKCPWLPLFLLFFCLFAEQPQSSIQLYICSRLCYRCSKQEQPVD